MASIKINNVSKIFDNVVALKHINLEFIDGEFISLLGPSGCGKTTLLRILAGFEEVSDGEVFIGKELVSSKNFHILPEKRNIGMVFQAYALWPHMSVWENIAFGLKIQKNDKKLIKKKVEEALEVVGLVEYQKRKPSELSGGQKQRVALARCMAMEPSLILFDEPLANLDLNLRESMLEEFKNFHKRLKCTMIYVTHDQGEAMALSDRIAVMGNGTVMQLGTPQEIYHKPVSEEVAKFVGRGMVIDGVVTKNITDQQAEVMILGENFIFRHHKTYLNTGDSVKVSIKSEDLRISSKGIATKVISSIYQGNSWSILLESINDQTTMLKVNSFDAPPKETEVVYIEIKDGWII